MITENEGKMAFDTVQTDKVASSDAQFIGIVAKLVAQRPPGAKTIKRFCQYLTSP